MNDGKKFEADFKKSASSVSNLSIDRFYDPVGGYAGIKNICDFVCYKHPYEYYFELKSHKGLRFPFDCITDTQYNGLIEKSNIPGVKAGILLKFADVGQHYYLPIKTIRTLREQGFKSITLEECNTYGIEMLSTKKRVTFNYHLDHLLLAINEAEE